MTLTAKEDFQASGFQVLLVNIAQDSRGTVRFAVTAVRCRPHSAPARPDAEQPCNGKQHRNRYGIIKDVLLVNIAQDSRGTVRFAVTDEDSGILVSQVIPVETITPGKWFTIDGDMTFAPCGSAPALRRQTA